MPFQKATEDRLYQNKGGNQERGDHEIHKTVILNLKKGEGRRESISSVTVKSSFQD